MAAPAHRRIALIVVQGVGDHSAAESIDQVGTGLVGTGSFRWGSPPPSLPVSVPPEGERRSERYDAERRRLLRGPGDADQIDLIAMRWSDLSSFPGRSLIAFVASAFGLGVQMATVGLEATPVGRSRAARTAWWLTWLAIAVATAALVVVAVARGGVAPWIVLVVAVASAGALVAVLWWSRGSGTGIANRLMEVTSWWVAALVIPLTVIAALAGTALWLVVDEPLGVPDALAVVAVAVAGVVAMRALGRGIAAGGWSYGEGAGLRLLVDPRAISLALLAGATAVTAWRAAATGSLAAGLAQTTLIVGGFAIRPAWMGCLALVALSLGALGLAQLRRPRADPRAAFTRVATTILSPLVVAVVGTVLVGGIGAVAFGSAHDATWGADGSRLRCLTGPSDWTWGRSCGAAGAEWPQVATAIAELDASATRLSARAADQRRAYVREGVGGPGAGAGAAAAAAGARRQAGELERAAGTNPTAWATDLFGLTMLPLAPAVALLVAGAVLSLSLVLARGGAADAPGARLSDALRVLTGPAASAALAAAAVAATVLGWLIWTIDPADTSGGGVADAWAWGSVVVLGALAVGRLLPLDPRGWRRPVGGRLDAARKAIDIPYDVATYLRIDRGGDGVRSRVVARYRALLGAVEAEYDRVVIAAHSQGSMYTLATLAGDRERSLPEGSDGWGVRPWSLAHPGSPLLDRGVSLLTFGCPVRQTYDERLPGQYSWTGAADVPLGERLATLSGPWVNAYRPRDYVGRAVFHPPTDTASNRQGHGLRRRVPVPGREAPIDLIDVCLHGDGGHTGYFADPELAVWLDYLLRRTLEPSEPGPPPGYAVGAPARAT